MIRTIIGNRGNSRNPARRDRAELGRLAPVQPDRASRGGARDSHAGRAGYSPEGSDRRGPPRVHQPVTTTSRKTGTSPSPPSMSLLRRTLRTSPRRLSGPGRAGMMPPPRESRGRAATRWPRSWRRSRRSWTRPRPRRRTRVAGLSSASTGRSTRHRSRTCWASMSTRELTSLSTRRARTSTTSRTFRRYRRPWSPPT